MKHVFVETNFLVGLLRPLPEPDAERLLGRVGKDVRLYLPWCSQAEAMRTLTGIVDIDLGFTDTMMRFAVRRWLADPGSFDKREVDKLKVLADAARKEALSTLANRIQETVAKLERIDPSPAVVDRTIRVFATKALKPFDEMVLGAVLAKADELYAAGERELYFCELDRDLASRHPPLVQEYAACGLVVLPSLDVP